MVVLFLAFSAIQVQDNVRLHHYKEHPSLILHIESLNYLTFN